VQRHPISIRPTALQRLWLESQRSRRGLAFNALILLAIEQAMAADPLPCTQSEEPERQEG
jgi:hypothetical protein